jgi:N-acetyl-beta-hexosaminidase
MISYTLHTLTLVQYAHMRGVRVIPEFELLSHATSICDPLKSEGIVCCSGKWGMQQLGDDPDGTTTRILSALLTEMAPLFPDAVVHIGGDETQYETTGPCTLNASKSLQQNLMKKLVALGKQPMGWQEILTETGAAASFPEAIIEPWSKAGLWAQVRYAPACHEPPPPPHSPPPHSPTHPLTHSPRRVILRWRPSRPPSTLTMM